MSSDVDISQKQIIIKVFGFVQGVFFRSETQKQAEKLGLAGWVENQSDGSVLITAQGMRKDLLKLIDFCYNGVKLARVDKVDFKWVESKNRYNNFIIKY